MSSIENYSLTGRRALVCGSTQGIGKACAERFAVLGAEVILVARSAEALTNVCAKLPAEQGQNHDVVCVDFSEPEQVQKSVAEKLASVGDVQILLNNTGGPPPGEIIDAAPEDFLRAYRMHLIGNQLLLQTVLPDMKQAGYGRVINIISTSVKEPIPGLGVSNTTRWAVAAWAKTVSREVASFGITVNNVLPGFTDTARLRSLITSRANGRGVAEDVIRDEMFAGIPSGRFGEAEEVAAAAGFLASPAASYINGINLPVDGGRLATI
ncbi:MAG: SDR family oxidoreductase [Pirellulales bacterium]|nr:SDR family oxidoreductase [Pirellulales bacterium]